MQFPGDVCARVSSTDHLWGLGGGGVQQIRFLESRARHLTEAHYCNLLADVFQGIKLHINYSFAIYNRVWQLCVENKIFLKVKGDTLHQMMPSQHSK